VLGEAQLAAGRLVEAARSFRAAIRRDPADWESWYELGLATRGRERARALATARRLNPRSPELAELGS
jgi:Flp pilus assembly protein TadD